MSLRSEIIPYIDLYGLVAPNKCDPGTRGSDNGPMFTSEFFILLKKLGELTPPDLQVFVGLIGRCIDTELRRAPGDPGLDEADDYDGVFAACNYLGINLGLKLPLRLWRMPQLIYLGAKIAWWKVWQWPLALYSALIIATSCIGRPIEDSDSRRLSWLLIQGTQKSLLCRLASKIWYSRLYKTYGPEGMRGVAAYYYQKGHPFIKYWVN